MVPCLSIITEVLNNYRERKKMEKIVLISGSYKGAHSIQYKGAFTTELPLDTVSQGPKQNYVEISALMEDQ